MLRSGRACGVIRIRGGAAGRRAGVRRAAHCDDPLLGKGARHLGTAGCAHRARRPGGLEQLADGRLGDLRPTSRRPLSGDHVSPDDLGRYRGNRSIPATGDLPGRAGRGAATGVTAQPANAWTLALTLQLSGAVESRMTSRVASSMWLVATAPSPMSWTSDRTATLPISTSGCATVVSGGVAR